MRRKRSDNKKVFQSLTLITQFGINILVPIGLMSWLGMYLDDKFGTSYWMIILFFMGAIAGFKNVYRMAKGIYKGEEKKEVHDRTDKED